MSDLHGPEIRTPDGIIRYINLSDRWDEDSFRLVMDALEPIRLPLLARWAVEDAQDAEDEGESESTANTPDAILRMLKAAYDQTEFEHITYTEDEIEARRKKTDAEKILFALKQSIRSLDPTAFAEENHDR